jgi:hypothetical protein
MEEIFACDSTTFVHKIPRLGLYKTPFLTAAKHLLKPRY